MVNATRPRLTSSRAMLVFLRRSGSASMRGVAPRVSCLFLKAATTISRYTDSTPGHHEQVKDDSQQEGADGEEVQPAYSRRAAIRASRLPHSQRHLAVVTMPSHLRPRSRPRYAAPRTSRRSE